MDAVFLSRLQFAFAAGFHFLFPPTTLGLTLIIVVFETSYLRSKNEFYKNLSDFLIKILGLVFVLGVATGISLEFAFGANWSEYSRMVGDVFGAPLAAEAIFSFFLESIFLGILLFGRKKVSKRMFWLSTILVFFAAHFSGFWIIIANSFMQTPAGFAEIGKGKIILTNFSKAVWNHSTLIRYIHTIIAGWITGAILFLGIGAWYIIKEKHCEYAKKLIKTCLVIFIFSGIIQLFSGHVHSVQVAKTQPEKLAAFEGLWENQKGAPLSIFGIPDEKKEQTHFSIGIPRLLSFLIHFDADAEIKGLKSFPKQERPPVLLSFASYHIMILIGTLFAFMAIIGGYLKLSNKLWQSKWFLKLMILMIPLPYIANETGWIAAEVGRQPWAIYKLLKTSDAASIVVPASHILFTLLMFIVIYTLLFTIFLKILLKILKKGPKEIKANTI